MRSVALFFVALILCLSSRSSFAHNGSFADWFNMVSESKRLNRIGSLPLPPRLRGSNRSFTTPPPSDFVLAFCFSCCC
jgi:hypothetical protein